MKKTPSFTLEQQLRTYAASGVLPMHMPGHKRRSSVFSVPDIQDIDITEIHGFDDLHDPSGILLESQSAAAALYGADRSFYLVNGSTAGILAGISACVKPGARILMARNCHLSVYHAVILNSLRPDYIYQPVHPVYSFAGSIEPQKIEAALKTAAEANDQYSLVVITSPTYEGVVSDIRQISGICRDYNVPLVVDEAHGAHFSVRRTACGPDEGTDIGSNESGTAEDTAGHFPISAISLGADIVIQSLHKTLPAPTQTGILHCRGSLVSPDSVKRFLDIYQTSSPSYIFLCGIENALQYREKADWDAEWIGMLNCFYEKTENLKTLRMIPPGKTELFFDRDPSKIVISAAGTGCSGNELMTALREEYGIETEMAAGDYVIAMSGAGDTGENLDKLEMALIDLDRKYDSYQTAGLTETASLADVQSEYILPPAQAFYAPCESVPVRASVGRIAQDIVTVYPPGIPLIVPGERISPEMAELIINAGSAGLHVTGMKGQARNMISVIKR